VLCDKRDFLKYVDLPTCVLQVQLGGNAVPQQLIATALQPSHQPPQPQSTATTQNIIVHQLPTQTPQTQLSVPQQIIITTQPPQPAPQVQPQPAQINLQQLQQVRRFFLCWRYSYCVVA